MNHELTESLEKLFKKNSIKGVKVEYMDKTKKYLIAINIFEFHMPIQLIRNLKLSYKIDFTSLEKSNIIILDENNAELLNGYLRLHS